ncbi:MAG: hypothetical protein SGBAC_012520 [Bacillariaceae sp.]
METRRRILAPSSPPLSTTLKKEVQRESNNKIGKFDTTAFCNWWKRLSRIFGLLSIGLLLFLLFLSSSSSSIASPQILSETFRENHGIPLPQDASSSFSAPPTTVGRCTNLEYTSTSLTHKPVWIASYPGSGAEMVRDLVQALTGGLVGGSVYIKRDPPHQDCVSSKAVTCKTHWPLLPIHSPLDNPQDYNSNAILLIRNPIHAFPSRLNHLWEVQTATSAHTTQAPEKNWNRWITKNWKQQVKTYQELIHTWTTTTTTTSNSSNSSFPYHVQLVLPYEELTRKLSPRSENVTDTLATTSTTTSSTSTASTTDGYGPAAAKRLVKLLQEQAEARVVVGDENIACLWRHVVLDRPRKKRSDHAYTPGYTQVLKDRILAMIQSLLETMRQQQQLTTQSQVQEDLIRLLQQYSEHIQRNTRIIDA